MNRKFCYTNTSPNQTMQRSEMENTVKDAKQQGSRVRIEEEVMNKIMDDYGGNTPEYAAKTSSTVEKHSDDESKKSSKTMIRVPMVYNAAPCLANVTLPNALRIPIHFDVVARKIDYKQHIEDITNMPINCPITNCTHSPCTADILSHAISYHPRVKVVEIFGDEPKMLVFDFKNIKPYETDCCYILAYGGKHAGGGDDQRPVTRRICRGFNQLSNPLGAHLPIAVLCSKINIKDFFSNGDAVDYIKSRSQSPADKAKTSEQEDENDYIVVLWLASHETTIPICYSLLIYNNNLVQSCTAHLRVRPFRETQVPCEFVCQSIDYFYLKASACKKFETDNDILNIEIKINECDN